jgi:RNA recognition motif-containing protein
MEQQNKLYVGNFPFSWKEEDLEQVFGDYKDKIVEIKIIYDQFSGRSKGFAFITFDDEAAATKALEKADSKAGDRTLVVSHARPPAARDRNGGGGGGRSGRSGGGGGEGFRRGGGYGGR